VALITDYDTGIEGIDDIEPVTMEAVLEVVKHNVETVRRLLVAAIPRIP
jgi:purine nucleoside phosphorylase